MSGAIWRHPCNFAIWGPRDPKFGIILVFSIKSLDIKFQVSTTSVRQVRAGPVLAVATWRARPKRPYVLGCNFCSSWNFDMGSSSMDSWDDSLSRWVGSNLAYLHSKGVKNWLKVKNRDFRYHRRQNSFILAPSGAPCSENFEMGLKA